MDQAKLVDKATEVANRLFEPGPVDVWRLNRFRDEFADLVQQMFDADLVAVVDEPSPASLVSWAEGGSSASPLADAKPAASIAEAIETPSLSLQASPKGDPKPRR